MIDSLAEHFGTSIGESKVMSSSCSRQSRVLLAAMRSQLEIALDQHQVVMSRSSSPQSPYSSLVSCRKCGGFMVRPVCLPCGHSLCHSCVHKAPDMACPKCKRISNVHAGERTAAGQRTAAGGNDCSLTPTLTLQNTFSKWYPEWVESSRCREEGNRHANNGDFVSATHWYTQALETGTTSTHRPLKQVHMYTQALKTGIIVCTCAVHVHVHVLYMYMYMCCTCTCTCVHNNYIILYYACVYMLLHVGTCVCRRI